MFFFRRKVNFSDAIRDRLFIFFIIWFHCLLNVEQYFNVDFNFQTDEVKKKVNSKNKIKLEIEEESVNDTKETKQTVIKEEADIDL